MDKLIDWFIRNHVAANFLMAIVVVLGFMTWGKLKKEIFPETSIDTILVTVPYPNATPSEVESGIIVPIEEAIQDVNGIERIRSTASQNVGSVTIEVAAGFVLRNVMDDVKTRVDAITNFAEEAEEPVLQEVLIKAQVLSIAVSADVDEQTLREIAERVREDLLVYSDGTSSISQASIAGVRSYEISIEVSENTLRQYGLTFDDVAGAVRLASLDLPGGSVRTSGGEVLIRTEGKRYTAEEFADVTVITRSDGSSVQLQEIATIRDAFTEDPLESRFDGRPAALINVFRVGNEDTLEIAETAKKYVYEAAPERFPENVELEIWRDDSLLLSGRLDLLARNGLTGLLLVAFVLALFLRPSLALLVALGIPVSFAGAIWMMPHNEISINMISLFAFILVLGIVVDDAIVVGENVYRRLRTGEDPRKAASEGTHEVGMVVIFGVITTAMAFTPMLGLSGVSGKIWPNIPLIVIPTLMFSLVQSKLILPSHLAMLKRFDPDEEPGPIMRFQRKFSRGLETFVEKFYRPPLRVALNSRWVVFVGFIAVFAMTFSLVTTGRVKSKFFPTVEGDILSAKLTMPKGVPFETTRDAIYKMEAAAERLGQEFKDVNGNSIIEHNLTSIGTQPFQLDTFNPAGIPVETNIGEVTLQLAPTAERDITGDELASVWRDYTGSIPGAVILQFQTETAAGGNAIDLELVGNDIESLEKATEEVKAALAAYDGVIDISDSNIEGKRELKLEILPGGEALGLRLGDIANQIRQGFYGEEVQRLQRGRHEVKVFVRYPRDERQSLADLENSKIRLPDGTEVPFSEVATASFGRSYSTVERADRQRMVRITADVDEAKGANANEVVASLTATGAVVEKSEKDRWMENILEYFGVAQSEEAETVDETVEGALSIITKKYPGITYSFEGEQKDQNQSVVEMGQKALIALLAMYVLMAIPLKSYIQPVIVMSVIPFGLVGAIWGHILLGYDLSIMSMCGIVALAGVVVNDSLVLVDYVNRQRRAGKSVTEAAWEAGAARFRAILLTSLTTFAGLTPMLLETDMQARFLIPMAVSLSFGILFATVITLFLVPCVYLMLEDVKAFFSKKIDAPETLTSEDTDALAASS